MNQDLPFPDGDPGLDQLFRTLTSAPDQAELSGQDAALAMFRANISPPASPPRPSRRRNSSRKSTRRSTRR